MPKDKKVIHFGYFLRNRRESLGLLISSVAPKAEMTVRQWIRIEKQKLPRSYGGNLAKIAGAVGMTLDELRAAWKATPVPVPDFKTRDFASRKLAVTVPVEVFEKVFSEAGGREETDRASRIVTEALMERYKMKWGRPPPRVLITGDK